jgi:hypothetical protein
MITKEIKDRYGWGGKQRIYTSSEHFVEFLYLSLFDLFLSFDKIEVVDILVECFELIMILVVVKIMQGLYHDD